MANREHQIQDGEHLITCWCHYGKPAMANELSREVHEPTRTEMMRRFSDKLSMEEIAEFGVWVQRVAKLAAAKARAEEHDFSCSRCYPTPCGHRAQLQRELKKAEAQHET